MAFKKTAKISSVTVSPDKLLLELPRRKIPDVLPHQREVLRNYADKAVDVGDVALQLPTGSGKTLVGLLIAEWRRRKFGEKVVYLCPTRQLVFQTAEQGDEKYGISLIPFVGSARSYGQNEKAEYRNGDKVAVTTYNSLFNTNPFFDDADIVIVDDAHAAENYIASMWSLQINRATVKHKPIHAALAALLKPHLRRIDFSRMIGEWNSPSDKHWVDKIPTPTLYEIQDELSAILDAHVEAAGLQHEWSELRSHLDACHLYVSANDILLRPLIAPTWGLSAFSTPKQRIFMSATLGAGGDLERLTGRSSILRLSVPEGWETQGVGRRFFMFPGMSLDETDIEKTRLNLMAHAGRSLVMVPNKNGADVITEEVEQLLKFPVFSADDIEQSKAPFVSAPQAVALIANRYDGIDFPGNECRFLCVDGLPKATNSQERFLMSRMGANVLFNERIQTRVLQAIGRCTRSLEDFSAVFVTGEELQDYLADKKRRKYFHPELQAEINFGVEQSIGVSGQDFIDNFKVFFANGKEWEAVNVDIVTDRHGAQREAFPAIEDLAAAVGHELKYQKAMWNGDYEAAVAGAEGVLSVVLHSDLKGYRANWHYLAASAAWLGAKAGLVSLEAKSRIHFDRAKKATSGLPWLVSLAGFHAQSAPEAGTDLEVLFQIEQLEGVLAHLGVVHEAAYVAREKQILEGLNSKDKVLFEEAHRLLGEMLGFVAGNSEDEAAPDPWWLTNERCFVFEDHQGALETSSLDTKKARQAASHPNWISMHVSEAKGLEIIPILVTPVTKARSGAIPHLVSVKHWNLKEFVSWSQNALATIRQLRTGFTEPGDLDWRAKAMVAFDDNGLSAAAIAKWLQPRAANLYLASDGMADE